MVPAAEKAIESLGKAVPVRPGQSGISAHHALLEIPSEIRIRIYECLFSSLSVSPATTTAGELPSSSSSTHDRNGSEHLDSPTHHQNGSNDNVDNSASKLSHSTIFLVCRQTYQESHPVFLRQALFVIKNVAQHDRFTQPAMLSQLNAIRNLSVTFDLLAEWPPTLLRLVMRSLARFEITDIPTVPGHADMLDIEGRMNGQEARVLERVHQGDHSPSIALFQAIITSMERSKADLVMAHCNAGVVLSRDMLSLQFKVRCRHVGSSVVPGQFPMVAAAPHEHPVRELVYTFGRRRVVEREVESRGV